MNTAPLWLALWTTAAVAAGSTLAAQTPTPSPHGELRLPCATCHTSAGWAPVRVTRKFDHAAYGLALVGAHAEASCRSCHRSLAFKGAPAECAACHEDAHRGELGADCGRCHTPRSFIDRSAMTRSHRLTRFPLEGVHHTLDCQACHRPSAQGRLAFVNRSTECVDCHAQSYAAAKAPDHVAAGFSRVCASCHTAWTWQRARFDHAGTGFPLTGAHRPLACAACHADGWTGRPGTCVACHQTDYDGATSPDHRTLALPTDCASCHNTTAWSGGLFAIHDASFFPIFSGEHRGKWSACTDCHATPGAYTQFTCVSCHSQRSMDDHHKEITGYGSAPADCLRCHPTGRKP